MIKTKNKFKGFTTGEKSAFVKGDLLSGIFSSDAVFKLTIESESELTLTEVDTHESDEGMRSRLVDIIDTVMETKIYKSDYIVSGLTFTDINNNKCYLIKEVLSPYEQIKSLVEEDINVSISDTITTDSMNFINSIIDDDILVEEDINKSVIIKEDIESKGFESLDDNINDYKPSEYISDIFKELSKSKEDDILNRINSTEKEIKEAESKYKSALSLYNRKMEDLELLKSRYEDLSKPLESNGIKYHLTETVGLEEIDDNIKEALYKINRVFNANIESILDVLKNNIYMISFESVDELDKIKLDPFIKWLKSDITGNIMFIDDSTIKYSGKFEWHDINNKLTKLGFEQDTNFSAKVDAEYKHLYGENAEYNQYQARDTSFDNDSEIDVDNNIVNVDDNVININNKQGFFTKLLTKLNRYLRSI